MRERRRGTRVTVRELPHDTRFRIVDPPWLVMSTPKAGSSVVERPHPNGEPLSSSRGQDLERGTEKSRAEHVTFMSKNAGEWHDPQHSGSIEDAWTDVRPGDGGPKVAMW